MLTRFKRAKNLKIAICLFMATMAIFLSVNLVLAAGQDFGLGYAAETGLSNNQDIRVTIAKIIRIALGFLGIIAVGLIIYAGWLWMTSAGNPEKIEQAKKILTNAVIGLIIIFSSFAIASFVLNALIKGSGGGQGGPAGGGPPRNYGLSALGNGIIESHYPARDQKDVPRNTSIIISFREPMLANTLCETAGAECAGQAVNQKVIRIFKKSDEAVCVLGSSPSAACAPLLAGAKVWSSADGKSFVIAPNSYLGSASEYLDYTVYLNSGLKRRSGEAAFPGFEKDYGWSFEVSDRIDLTPPQVIKERIFPAPDNDEDTTDPVSKAKAASGSITINSQPLIGQAAGASVTGAGAGSPAASAEVNKACPREGNFSVAVSAGQIASLYKVGAGADNISLGQGVFGLKNGKKQVIFSECDLSLTLTEAAANFAAGNSWNLILNKATIADTITIGNLTYTAGSVESGANFKVFPDNYQTARSIRSVIAGNPNIGSIDILAKSVPVITIGAKIAGSAGNNINLSSNNPASLAIIPMAGGTDKENKITTNGGKDQPRNSSIQIVFDEAITPLTVSGTSDELKDFIRVVNADSRAKIKGGACSADADCRSFICDNGQCAGDNEYLKGKFFISNQYSTVEFLSDKECGFNSCGEKIYCLPGGSNLRVELKAAGLIPCADDDGCRDKSPFNLCHPERKFCWDGKKYFPQADKNKPSVIDGLADSAFNSLDGNRDGMAYGPASFYNENTPLAAAGDSYEWSFFISQELILTPPMIKTTAPAINGSEVDLNNAVKVSFNRLMLSSRLTTGSLMIKNGDKNITHYLLNLRSYLDQPLGYWVTNIGRQSVIGGEIDSTDAFINHSPFSQASTYKAQAGSGLKDIYQNCFLPCSSLNSAGAPSCCNGAAYDKESCP